MTNRSAAYCPEVDQGTDLREVIGGHELLVREVDACEQRVRRDFRHEGLADVHKPRLLVQYERI